MELTRANLDQCQVRLPEHVLLRRVEGEAIALHLDDEHYYHLDEIATSMVLALDVSDTVRDAVRRLLEEFEVQEHVLVDDLCALVAECAGLGLLLVQPIVGAAATS